MKILCMPQAFKGTLTAAKAAEAMVRGVHRVLPHATALALPMADGGDDTLDVLVSASRGSLFYTRVTGPRGTPVNAGWGVLGDRQTAVIEMATASGVRLLPPSERDPRVTSTIGTGELLKAALDRGFRKIIVGVGGSATVDGGTGAAAALGARFLNAQGEPLEPGGAALLDLASIALTGIDARAQQADIVVACDVDMPLCGEGGAWTFAAQKGASPETARLLARAMERLAEVVHRQLGIPLATLPLGGPAGGLSGGLHAFLGARLAMGAPLIFDMAQRGREMAGADLVLTGEGTLDHTSFRGKGTMLVAQRARAAGVPVIAIAGQARADEAALREAGVIGLERLVEHTGGIAKAEADADEAIEAATAAAIRDWRATTS